MYRFLVRVMLVTSLVLPAVLFGWHPSEAQAALKGCPVGKDGLVGRTNSEKGFNFFLKKGLKPIHSAAIIGNFLQETAGMNPSRVNSIGAHGIAQWYQGRRTGLYRFANSRKIPVNSLSTQLRYAWYELNGSNDFALNHLRKQTNLPAATLSVRVKYERPGEHEAMDHNRLKYARGVLARGRATNFCGLAASAKAPGKPAKQRPKKKQKASGGGLGPTIEGVIGKDVGKEALAIVLLLAGAASLLPKKNANSRSN